MNQNNNNTYLIAGLALLVGLFMFKKKPTGGGDDSLNTGVIDDCQSTVSDSNLKAIAKGLKDIFDSYMWDLNDQEQARIISLFSQMGSACDYRKVVSYFGILNSTFTGDGNLDFWMSVSAVDDHTREACRQYCYGLSTF